MADVPNRQEREGELKAALNLVWNAWVKVANPANLDPTKLIELLDKHVRQPLWGVWISGYEQLTSNYNKPATDAQIAAAFLLFYRKWADDLIARWVARVTIWMTERAEATEAATGQATSRPAPQQPTIPIQGQGQTAKPSGPTPAQTPPKPSAGPSTQPTPSSLITPSSRAPSKPVSLPVVQPPPAWNRSKGDLVMDYDVEREAVDAVTSANTDAETDAAKRIESSGQGRFTAIWRTEPGACPKCEPLEGTPPSVWRTVAPDGPGLHPNCLAGDTRIQAYEVVSAIKADYYGPLVRIRTVSDDFVVTPGHMLLTDFGFIRCWSLVPGMYLIAAPNKIAGDATRLYETLDIKYGSKLIDICDQSLHGDGCHAQGRASLVRARGLDDVLSGSDLRLNALRKVLQSTGSGREEDAMYLSDAVDRAMLGAEIWEMRDLSWGPLSKMAPIVEDLKFHLGQNSGFQLTRVQSVERFTDHIPVYDFQTRSTLYYVGNGIVSSNCRCWLQWSPWLE